MKKINSMKPDEFHQNPHCNFCALFLFRHLFQAMVLLGFVHRHETEILMNLLVAVMTLRLVIDDSLPKLEENTLLQKILNRYLYLLILMELESSAFEYLATSEQQSAPLPASESAVSATCSSCGVSGVGNVESSDNYNSFATEYPSNNYQEWLWYCWWSCWVKSPSTIFPSLWTTDPLQHLSWSSFLVTIAKALTSGCITGYCFAFGIALPLLLARFDHLKKEPKPTADANSTRKNQSARAESCRVLATSSGIIRCASEST